MRKKIINLILTVTMVVSVSGVLTTPVYATPSISNIEESIQMYDNQIQESMNKVNVLNNEIENTQNEIADTENKIKINQEDYDKNFELFKDRLRTLYTEGESQSTLLKYIDVITSGKSISDIFDRFNIVSSIVKKDNEKIKELTAKGEELNKQKDTVIEYKKKLDDSKIDIENELNNINKNKENQLKLLAEQNQQNSIMSITEQVPFQMSADTSEKAKAIIIEGQKYLGVKYVWGGTTPSGFDCSGFTQYIYDKQGIHIPRVAEDQQQVGMTVPISQIKPGDLVFFGYPAHHVGMYLGNGQYIHAPHTGDVVRIAPLIFGNVTTIKRLLY